VGGLKPETSYSVSVAAYTTKGDGTHSKAKVVQTLGIGEHHTHTQKRMRSLKNAHTHNTHKIHPVYNSILHILYSIFMY
jgi:hypothetical protein